MAPRVSDRLGHITISIAHMRQMLTDKTMDDVREDVVLTLAFERLMEIVSEASRYIPEVLKLQYGSHINWRAIAALGNVLRHAYHLSDVPTLWRIYQNDVAPLEQVIIEMQGLPNLDAPTPPEPSRS